MVTADLYATDQTTTSGFQLTGLINTIKANYNEEFGNPYMMGYIPYENIPTPWKPFTIEYNAERNAIIAKSVMIPQNVGWGYVANLDNNLQTGHSDVYEYSNIWARIATTTDPKIRFINAGEIPKLNTTGLITFFNIVIKHDLSTDEYILNTTARQHTNIYVKDFIDFLNGNTTINFLINGNNVDIECITDDDGLIVYNDGTNDYYIIITYFACSQDTGNVQSNFRNYFNPFIKFTVQNEDDENTILEIPYTYGVSGSGYSYLVNATTSVVSEQSCYKFSDYFFGNISEGEYDLSDAQTLQTDYYKRFGNTFITRGSNNRYFVVCNYNSDDLISMLTIINKYKNNAQADTFLNGYDTTVSVAIFDDNNVPQLIRLSDNYSNLIPKLQPWQLLNADITENDFDPKNIPPYDPTPTDKENIGSDVIRPATLGVGGTNGFITQYALTASQIAEIGRLLWLSFTNIDYYKNFLFTLTTTGSIDLANLLDFFVTLRVYPFPLINVPSWASAGQDMYIGAGFIPLHFSSTLHTINNYADYIDAGTCEIPRYYGDFRDLTRCEIMLYLPYCGTVQLNPADVVGGTLHAQYAIDFATGGCIAYVDLITWDGKQYMIGALPGSVGADIPLTATNATQITARIASNALNVASTIGSGIVGIAGAASTAGAAGAGLAAAGMVAGVAKDALDIVSQDAVKMPMLAGGRGFAGFGSPQTAYVQIRRGLYAEGRTAPPGFRQAYGNMYAKPVTVDSCTGFTVFANVDTSGLTAQADERDAIRSLMQSGIYI